MAKEVKMRGDQVKDERGIFEGLLRFARYRPSRPGVTAGQPPAESAAHLERLVNAGPVAPYPVNSLVTPETEHDAAGEPGSQSSVLSGIKQHDRDYELDLFSGPHVVMLSPYRGSRSVMEADGIQSLTFSKEALISMDHGAHHLAIDLFRPERAKNVFTVPVFPLHDLSPLCLYRQLRSLSIIGMMQSYQSYIWLVVWLNPHLTELTLEMTRSGDRLDEKAIGDGREYAESKPSMHEVSQGKSNIIISQKLPIISLSLTNFVMDEPPFKWFAGDTMCDLRLHQCNTADFCLPKELKDRVRITITG